jgi:hypothetical protein
MSKNNIVKDSPEPSIAQKEFKMSEYQVWISAPHPCFDYILTFIATNTIYVKQKTNPESYFII